VKIVIDNVTVEQGDFRLNCDLTVEEGKMIALLGPSGSGKTTLLRSIAGFIVPRKGNIFLGENNITYQEPYQRNIGFLFQDLALFPHLSVKKNILFGMEMLGYSKDQKRDNLKKLLSLMGLEGFEHRKISQLSGGEKQRIALARALAINPYCLLLDEPLSALDAAVRKRLGMEIRRIQQEQNLTTLLVTHDRMEALNLCDQIVLMKEGNIVATGTPQDLYNRPPNLWTAEFLGQGFIAKMKNQQGNGATPFGDVPCDKDFTEGHILIRPEWFSMADQGFSGTVVASEFITGGYLLELKTASGSITIFHPRMVPKGETLKIKIHNYYLF